ncbi:DNA-directed RNA polymerase subunit D [archaeon]|jgi:DNA-directed RNA polymerase subunit D|nr:DNA-directed RNA polymerase subunit D [archaeon]
METITKTAEEISFISDMNVSLANAIRRSVGEIPILAVVEADIYKNDSALYDEVIAHRLGLVSLKNQKLKGDNSVEMKLKVKGKDDITEVLAGELGDDVVYPETPIVLLGKDQVVEVVARAKMGKGNDHAKFMPGLVYYKHLAKIKISGDGEKQTELAEIYPDAFEMFGEKLKVKSAAACDLDESDMKEYPGVDISFGDDLVFTIESWGQIEAKEIFSEACKALKGNLSEVSKALK